MQRILVVFLVVCAARADSAAGNPLAKVIDLMDEVAAKVRKDGEAEVAAFKEFYEWCDDTSKNLQYDIKTGKAQKSKLEAKIEELASEIDTATSRIDELASVVAKVNSELKDATAIRKKEAADFAASEAELAGGSETLARGIEILERELQKNPAALAQLGGGGGARAAVRQFAAVMDAAGLAAADQRQLVGLIQSHEQDDDEEAGAPAAASYKSHSAGIVDTLMDMKEKVDAELSDLRKDEATSAQNFAMLKQSLESKVGADNDEIKEQKNNRASAEESKAGAEGDLEVTTADLAASGESLSSTQANCMTTASDHEESLKARDEELKVIAQAKKILIETTQGASFLQTSMLAARGTATSEIATKVKKLAKKMHSPALTQLASRIQAVLKMGSMGGANPFAKVKELIANMIQKLEDEADTAADEKAFCDEAMAKTEAKRDGLNDDVDRLSSKVDQATAKSVELQAQVQDLQAELAALAKAQEEMDRIRAEEHEAYAASKADLEQGLDGVRKAVDVLSDYYGSGGEDAPALLQDASAAEQPAVPTHASSGGAGGGIIGILEVVETDFAKELAKIETEEADEAALYAKTTQENKIAKTQKDQDVKYKTQEIKSLESGVSDMSADRESLKKELAAVVEYYNEVQGRCVAKPESYEEKKKRREAEMAGLKQALETLESETAFVQQRSQRRRSMRGSLSRD